MLYAAKKPSETKPDASPVAEPDEVVRLVKTTGSSVADALTPARLITLLRSADEGDLSDQCDLFEQMEDRDAKLDGFMRQRKLGLISCGWELQEPEANAKAQGRKGAEGNLSPSMKLCQEVLDGIPAFNDRLFDLLDALGKGFAALEIIWDSSEKQWRPRDLEWRPQRWFTLNEAGDAIHLKTKAEQVHGEPLNPTNWILHKHRARSGFDPRIGLYRSCTRPFVVRNYGWKDWLAFAEIFGMPLRVGTLRQGATAEEKRLMWLAVQAIGVDAAALVPEGSSIEFPTAGSGGVNSDIFEKLIAGAEDDYVIAILGQRLTTGGAEGGSYALGKVHDAVRHDLVEADAGRLEESIHDQLLAPTVAFNLGPAAPVPQFKFKVEQPEDLGALATTLKTLSEAGFGSHIPASYVHDKFGIPEPEDGEETLDSGGLTTEDTEDTENADGDSPEGAVPDEAAAEVAAKAPFVGSPAEVISRARSSSSDRRNTTDGPSRRSATPRSYSISSRSKPD